MGILGGGTILSWSDSGVSYERTLCLSVYESGKKGRERTIVHCGQESVVLWVLVAGVLDLQIKTVVNV